MLGKVPVGTRPGTRPRGPHADQVASAWLLTLRLYLGLLLIGDLIWEALQLPLYTIWTTGTPWEQAFAVVHCTLADLVIAACALTLALLALPTGRGIASGRSQSSQLLSASHTRFSANGGTSWCVHPGPIPTGCRSFRLPV